MTWEKGRRLASVTKSGVTTTYTYNTDGKVTVTDALAALRIAAKLVPETPEAIAIGDIDGDGHVSVTDALAILRVAAKLVPSL